LLNTNTIHLRILLLAAILFFTIPSLKGQNKPVHPTLVGKGVFKGETRPLRDLPTITSEEIELMREKAFKKAANKKIEPRLYPYAKTALPKGPDEAWQKAMGKSSGVKAPVVNFKGQTTSFFPPDCNGTAGPNHYMQTVNATYAIYSKTGRLLAGPTNMNLLFGSVAGATCNDGDPLIQYDEQAGRWIAAEFSFCGSNDFMLIAVSSTNDPTGTWYQYSFDVDDMPDYEKIGVWQDGYYMGTNNNSGNDIYVFERSRMLLGQSAQMVAFDNSWRPGTGFLCVPPLDNDGAAAPAGTPGMFIAFNDDAVAGGSDQLWLYDLAVNWTTPSSSTFNRTQQLNVTPFDSQFTSSWDDITQPTSQKLDAVPQVIMNAPQYRNFGTYQTIVCCHTVDVDGTNHAGIRWYELRKTSPATTWTIRQQGTYSPDAHSRWMGSIMLNSSGKIGLGYSISSSTIYPGIRYCGQSSSAYASATGILDIAEEVIHNGTVAQISYNRWGDYALLSVDPTDDQTFWFSSEHLKAGGTTKGTKIASFRFGNDPAVTTLAATAIARTKATINGTVNPIGLATSYYFQWGITATYGNNTTTISVGSGTSAISVYANLTGLTFGTTYHFRLVATNSDGTSFGADLTFTPGAAAVTTTAASAIAQTSATSGGAVTSDGGSAVTKRGVCWGIAADPTIADRHSTDGSGLGVFTSTLSGLSPSTTYHMRAYATNSSGTYYGGDLMFNTLCGVYTLPFSESFSNTTIPYCWSQVDNQANGEIWFFGTITGQKPNPVLTGNYAYLNSDEYGSNNSQNADLITPTFDLTGYSAVILQFKHYFLSYSGSSGTLSYSIDNGTTWTQIQQFTATSINNPELFNQVITAVGNQSQVKFKWNYTATWGYSWAVDDVTITSTFVSLSVTPPNQNVTADAGNASFTVTSNSGWIASSDQTWCTVNPSGSDTGIITADFALNSTINPRVANITVTVEGLTPVVVTVSQAGVTPILTVNPGDQRVNAYNGSINYTVTSNTDWTASSDSVWCIVTGSGSGNGNITADYSFNPYANERSTKISVDAAGLLQVVTLTQGQEVVSVSDHSGNGIRIYPNPSKGVFKIIVDKAKYPTMQVTIGDLAGAALLSRMCKGDSEYRFDTGTLPQGCYFVKIKAGNELLTRKLIIIN